MAKRTTDRRVPRTRALLQQGLCALLRKKRYETITVDDICAAANVGRSTFYAHFRSKDDLKRSGLESLHGALAERQKAARASHEEAHDRRFGFSLSVFQHARDHADHYRTLVGGRGGAVALAKVRQMLTDLVRSELAATSKGSVEGIPSELVVQYAVGAYMAVLTWWLDGGAKLPAERVDAIFRRLATRGIECA
jgi:AcrR family transcriptional regulator